MGCIRAAMTPILEGPNFPGVVAPFLIGVSLLVGIMHAIAARSLSSAVKSCPIGGPGCFFARALGDRTAVEPAGTGVEGAGVLEFASFGGVSVPEAAAAGPSAGPSSSVIVRVGDDRRSRSCTGGDTRGAVVPSD